MKRRQFLTGIAAGSAALTTGLTIGLQGQDPPTCPPAPVNGIPFRRGQDTRPVIQRKAVSSLSSSQISQLRLAFARLRSLPSTDNRRWVIQADMHALYCQACNHDRVQSVHHSWIFFPWHRAFIYYFERILGSLVGDINHFRLPYWDWENHRFQPEIYAIPANSSNSLYDANRYGPINQGANLPSTDGSAKRIALLYGIADFATFGGTASRGGACESNPHDAIHDDIGLHTSPFHDMGHLGYAARDPIFYAHHCNIDKIWSNWNALAATRPSPAYRNPTEPAFLSERWNFYDENRRTVSMSAADVLNYPSYLRYTYAAPTTVRRSSASAEESQAPEQSQAPIVNMYEGRLKYSGSISGPVLDLSYRVKTSLIEAVRNQDSVAIVLREVPMPKSAMGVFDIVSVRGVSVKHLGVIAVVADAMQMGNMPKTVVLDATEAVDDLVNESNPARITVVPRNGNGGSFTLHAEEMDLRVISRR
jgi:hypothetical protein